MPELPEVETIVRGLNSQISDLTISRITHISPHLRKREPKLSQLVGDTFTSFSRRGKYIIVNMRSGRQLLIHLRMSGRLLIRKPTKKREKHEHLIITFDDSNDQLVFRDLRKFGVFEFLNKGNQDALDRLGDEAPVISARKLHQSFLHSRRPVKSALLDQTVIAGLGNIYVDETLYRCGIHPKRLTSSITYAETQQLVNSIRVILRQAIKNMGTTFDSFSGVNGDSGRHARYLKVYQRAGSKCKRCSDVIAKFKLGGRGTHVCPTCQPINS